MRKIKLLFFSYVYILFQSRVWGQKRVVLMDKEFVVGRIIVFFIKLEVVFYLDRVQVFIKRICEEVR